MRRIINRRLGWRTYVAVVLASLAFGFVVRSLLVPRAAALTANPQQIDSDVNLLYQHQEPVGWVFGRVVGFEGADKPMLLRHSFPPMNGREVR